MHPTAGSQEHQKQVFVFVAVTEKNLILFGLDRLCPRLGVLVCLFVFICALLYARTVARMKSVFNLLKGLPSVVLCGWHEIGPSGGLRVQHAAQTAQASDVLRTMRRTVQASWVVVVAAVAVGAVVGVACVGHWAEGALLCCPCHQCPGRPLCTVSPAGTIEWKRD
jgi:TRAP-type uncharacterized transport system fused permease subunit